MDEYISIYFNKENLHRTVEHRCVRCGGLMFKVNKLVVLIYNSTGLPLTELPDGTTMIEHKCGRCNTFYRGFFQ